MSVAVRYENGVFTPLEDISGASPGKRYRVFAEEEILSFKEDLMWLRAAKPAFEFWDNEEDAVYDGL
jgi:predicted DNA-binding antitoxin AbrB/MazE fold protein